MKTLATFLSLVVLLPACGQKEIESLNARLQDKDKQIALLEEKAAVDANWQSKAEEAGREAADLKHRLDSERAAADELKAEALLARRECEELLAEVKGLKDANQALKTEIDSLRGKPALPSDDPVERWKELTKTKFENIRRIDLKGDDGMLETPEVTVYGDAEKKAEAGSMNHDEWVVVLETLGDMTKIRRRRDRKEAWIETRFLKKIYTTEDVEDGPRSGD